MPAEMVHAGIFGIAEIPQTTTDVHQKITILACVSRTSG